MKFKQIYRAAAILLLACALPGCVSRGYTKSYSTVMAEGQSDSDQQNAEQNKRLYEEHLAQNNQRLYDLLAERVDKQTGAPDYKIGKSDIIKLSVLGVPEISGTLRVSQSGNITLPLLGKINIAGATRQEATQTIKERLQTQLRDPLVTLEIEQYSGHEVSVLGAVAEPGSVILSSNTSNLLQILGNAGGITEQAGNFLTFVPAASNAEETSQAIELPLAVVLGLNGNPPLEIPVIGGDSIIVNPAGSVLVEGEVESRGSYELDENITLIGALAAAGGVTYGANVYEVEVVRKIDAAQTVSLVYDLEKIQAGIQKNPMLKSGDIVRVPSDNSRRMSQDFFQSLRRFIGFGGVLPM